MFGVGVHRPKNATLLDGPNHTCRIKSQSFKVAYDKAIVTEWSTDKMGHTALPIWDAISTTKIREGTGGGRFFSWASRSEIDQTLWGSPRRGRWSLSDPDVFRRTGVVALLRRWIKNGSRGNVIAGSGGSPCLPNELRNPSCILINWAMFE